MLSSGIEQQRNPDGSGEASHPVWQPHPQQGWSPDSIPKLAGDAVDMKVISRIVRINNADAMHWSRELARKEGIFVGITSGATFFAALRVAAEAPRGSTILCMPLDTGERYLSTPLLRRYFQRHDRGRAGDRTLHSQRLASTRAHNQIRSVSFSDLGNRFAARSCTATRSSPPN